LNRSKPCKRSSIRGSIYRSKWQLRRRQFQVHDPQMEALVHIVKQSFQRAGLAIPAWCPAQVAAVGGIADQRQWLAVPLWVPTDKNSVPTVSGHFRSQFCGREIVNAVLIVGGVAFEKAAHTASLSARTPPERVTRRHRLALQTIGEPRSPLRAYWSVYELTDGAPGSRRAAGSRSTRTECPRICWQRKPPSQPRQFAVTIAVRSWWLCGLRKVRTR